MLARPGAAWVLLCAGLALGALVAALWRAAPDAIPAAGRLDWQPALALTEPWRAWTAAFVHLSTRHLLANLAGCAVVAWLGWRAALPARAALAWLLAWPLGHAMLAAVPTLAHYGGLSGVLHGGVAVASVGLWRRPPRRERWIGAALLAGLALKLVAEAPWRGAVQHVAGWDIPVAPVAHLTGAVAGLACAVLLAGRQAPGERNR